MRIRSVDNCSLPPFFLNGDLKQCRRMAVQDFGPDRFPSYFLSHRPLEPDANCPIPPQLPLGLSKSLDSATPWILIGHLVIGVVLSKALERLPVFTKGAVRSSVALRPQFLGHITFSLSRHLSSARLLRYAVTAGEGVG